MMAEGEAEQFSLRWNNFHSNLTAGFHALLQGEDLVDVTLAADGQFIRAHKIVLSVCSPYFKELFKVNPCKHPIVILKDVSHKDLVAILQFMYQGEVNVRQEELTTFLKTAEMLQIKGLTGDDTTNEEDRLPVPPAPVQRPRVARRIVEKPPHPARATVEKKQPPPPTPVPEMLTVEPEESPAPPPYKRMRPEVSTASPAVSEESATPPRSGASIEYLEVPKPKMEPVEFETEIEEIESTSSNRDDPLVQLLGGESSQSLQDTPQDTMNQDQDLNEGLGHINDDLPVPRKIIRDVANPLEQYTNSELVQRFGFSRQTIQDVLLPMVNDDRPRDNRGLPIPAVIKLCTALRFYATGSFQRVCGDLQAISQSSVSRIIKDVSERLCQHLPRYIRFPTAEELDAIRVDFFKQSDFPGVVGCVDGTHVEIKNPGGPRSEVFRNREGWMSMNVQAVVGPQCQIFDIVVRWPGSTPDNSIFNNSTLKTRFDKGEIRGILVGDSAYRQTNYLYTPVDNPQTAAEQRYNAAHSRARAVVERTFVQWKQRFRAIHGCLNSSLRNNLRIIVATAILHNIAKDREEFIPDPNFRLREVPALPIAENPGGTAIRRALIERRFQN